MPNKAMIDKLRKENILTRAEFLKLLTSETADEFLFESARQVKEQYYGKQVFARGLIEFSNYCKNDCYYCGIRNGNDKVERYRLTEEEIYLSCKTAYHLGYRTFVLQGGEDEFFEDAFLEKMIGKIKQEYPDCALTLSIGEREKESYQRLFDAGCDRYLLRHETANEQHYQKLHPKNMRLENRKECLRNLKEIGFQVGCGMMVGSPFQTLEEVVDDLLFIKELDPHMVGVGPFITHQDTPFRNFENGSVALTLKLLAIIRLMLPKVLLPATTALQTLHPLGRELALERGANVVMPNVTPLTVRKKYMLYDNKACTQDTANQCRNCVESRIKSTKNELVISRGDYYV